MHFVKIQGRPLQDLSHREFVDISDGDDSSPRFHFMSKFVLKRNLCFDSIYRETESSISVFDTPLVVYRNGKKNDDHMRVLQRDSSRF